MHRMLQFKDQQTKTSKFSARENLKYNYEVRQHMVLQKRNLNKTMYKHVAKKPRKN